MDTPFDPILLARETEKVVVDGTKRKYNLFRVERFYGQIATARAVGCNLRCGFCWINSSRDQPLNYGEFLSPEEVYTRLIDVSSNQYGRGILTSGLRISGAEPTLGRDHLLGLLEIIRKNNPLKWFLLETNALLLGNDESYVRDLAEFKDFLKVRPSIKAGTPEDFQRKTGAKAEFFDLPFQAIKYLIRHGIEHRVATVSLNPLLMPSGERRALFHRLLDIGPEYLTGKFLEEEGIDLFEVTKRRLVEAGLVENLEDLGSEEYNPVHINELDWAARKFGCPTDPHSLLDMTLFTTSRKECRGCNRSNPWHGHDVEDDLDPKLS